MSTVEMMGIQGIRSFGPDKEDFQRVKFFKPLTLILGPNGTGKTTIIECLKYATTGDMPPGSKGAGAAFVHDPKLANEKEIKGQIKLMIQDVSGAKCTVERSMSAKVKDGKGKKVELKTLDGVLTRVNQEGEKNSVTSRCADLNREMIGALGVSKAVLENVIFCHQEDSNWPLSEGKVLKEKFDDIFASTRYTKVLDELKKLKQSQDGDIREGKKELEYLKQLKQKTEQLQEEQDDLEAKQAASMDSVDKIENDLKPIRDKLEDINVRYNEICRLETSKQRHVAEKRHAEQTIQDLSEKIKDEFQGSTAELKKVLKDFSSKVQEKKVELKEREQEQQTLNDNWEKLSKEKSLLLVEVGKLQNEADIHQENIKRRDANICEISNLYGFEGFDESTAVDETKYRTFFQLMKEKLEAMMQNARKKKEEYEVRERQLQEKIDSLKENKTRLEHSEKMKRESMVKNEEEIRDLKIKLNQVATSAGRLTTLVAELKRAENALHTAEASVNVEDLKKEISELDRQKRQLDASISDLNTEMNRLHKHSKIQTELDMLVKSQQEKETIIQRLRTEHEDNIVSLLGHISTDNLREAVSTYISNQSDNVKQCDTALRDLRNQLTTKEADKKSTAALLRKEENELRGKEEKISSICESEDLEEECNEVQKNLTQAQEERGSLLGANHMINKYIKNLEKNNPACPLCQRCFQQDQEVRELILKLQEQLRKVPANIRKAEQDMEKYQRKYDDIMKLKPVKEMVISLRERDIPSLKTKLKKLDEDIKKLKEEVENKEDDYSIQDADLHTAKNIQPDIVDMDRRRGEVRELERKIQDKKALLGGSDETRTMDEVIREKEKVQLNLDTVNRTLDHRRETLSEHQEQTQNLRSKVNELQQEKLTIEGELQQKSKLEERKASLVSDNKNYERDIEESISQLKPLEKQIDKLVKDRESVSKEREEMMDKERGEVDVVKNKGNTVKNVSTEIKAYMQSGKSKKLKENQDKQAKQSAKQKEIEEQLEDVSTSVKRLNHEISNQQVRERELQDCLQLHTKQAEVQALESQIAQLEQQLGGLNFKTLERDRQRLLEQETKLNENLHTARGRLQGFKDHIRTIAKDLASDLYRDAPKKYLDKVIENKTTEIVNEDLQRYYGAMDKAIMMYHKSKMEEINIIIRELWKNTYTGNDIETIEIQSEADETTAAATTIKSRKNYNYRVVMIKNGIPVDMRGRCSAGQKVLASLIIRLALAETFCVNCGVLALDEPTTNLDRKNIESLAFALVQIIKDRSTQRHFQLVVITHDEDFVELLGRSDYVDEFVEVGKNAEGLSRLRMRRVEELHS